MAIALVVFSAEMGTAEAQPFFLVTPDEANLPDAPAEPSIEPREPSGPFGGFGRTPGKEQQAVELGPRILVVKPSEVQAVPAPLDIEVRFQAQDDAAVDLATLEVKYVKLVSIDITDRVRPYASLEGIRVERVSFPKGKHTIRISIADTRGVLTSRVLTVTIQ